MIYNELEATPFSVAVFILLGLIAYWLRKHPSISSQELADETLDEVEGNYTREDLNPEYGAYIWFAGKRFN